MILGAGQVMVGLMGRYINWFVGFCFINLIEMGKDQNLAMKNGRREWTEVEIGFFLNWRVSVWKNILEFEDHHFSRCFDCIFKIVWGYPVLWCVFQLEPKNSDTIPHCRQWLPRLLGLEWWTFCWLLTFICFKLGTKNPCVMRKFGMKPCPFLEWFVQDEQLKREMKLLPRICATPAQCCLAGFVVEGFFSWRLVLLCLHRLNMGMKPESCRATLSQTCELHYHVHS